MGEWLTAWWETDVTGVPRRDRRSGRFRAFVPDALADTVISLPHDVDLLVAEAERGVRALDASARDLAGIARFLLRSEAIASSRIEGIAPSARRVALAELGQSEEVQGVGAQAQLVANNMTVVRDATTRLVQVTRISVDDILTLHHSLLPDQPRHHGLRTVQNWIGGSDRHPLEADFVPPPADRVPGLMQDLVDHLAGATHSPIIQAALVHAQFETIHPFTDGNGRVGRALIHTVLARRGLVADAVLPISLVLATLKADYIAGLTRYRSGDSPRSAEGLAARAAWVRAFATATVTACRQAHRIADELSQVRTEWESRLAAHRESQGRSRAVRSDSAVAAILTDLPATPVLTARTVGRIHGVSHVAAGRALEDLCAAGILTTTRIGPGRRAYLADDVLDTITWAERRLAGATSTTTAPGTRPDPPVGRPRTVRRDTVDP